MKSFLIIIAFIFLSLSSLAQKKQGWTGAISNGFKGDTIRFDISADGKRLENLIFTGYWRCSGSIEQITMGPDKSYLIRNGKVAGLIIEPEGGGATAFRFDLNAVIAGKTASGTLRINLNAMGCDTHLLKWTARTK
jgi:hypothetical protein